MENGFAVWFIYHLRILSMQSKTPIMEKSKNGMRNLSVNRSSVLIYGDMNSRKKHLQNYVWPDVFENLNMQDLFDELQSELSSFEANRNFRL